MLRIGFLCWIMIMLMAPTPAVHAQYRLSAADRMRLEKLEDSLKFFAYTLVNGRDEQIRKQANDAFIPHLVNALKIRGSFYYPFDSLRQISILYAPDSSFRIFTWQFPRAFGSYRYYGAIQMNTRDGHLKLFPLFDNSEFTYHLDDTITGPRGWIGCIYYRLIETHFRNQKYYTLFGFNGNSLLSNKKILEPLTFPHGEPVFGSPIFSFANDSIPGADRNRFVLEYKKDGDAGLNYDDELKMIVYDELVPLHNEPEKKYTYVPDGNYEGFVWKNGKWVHVTKVFPDNQGPTPIPLPIDFSKKNLIPKDSTEEN
ncbi:hypothetical protein SAMN05660895_2213 [Thermoflavifilum thermophilum]|uniref:WG containing repeat-containing protein n=2 Tax=Thermoflavifilum thermophilum TaxID=1393122 RepID=A0A1I7NL73_9BACT|nr:hypothetical protein SAMN05660895_2213 [Thermoflavifilum thermophilum]